MNHWLQQFQLYRLPIGLDDTGRVVFDWTERKYKRKLLEYWDWVYAQGVIDRATLKTIQQQIEEVTL